MCFSCASWYEQEPTQEKYVELLSKKIHLSVIAKTQRDIDELQLEDGIKKVILGFFLIKKVG